MDQTTPRRSTAKPGSSSVVDPATAASNPHGVFAGSSSVPGADIVVTAIAEGKRAAAGMLAFPAQRTPVA